MKLTLLASIYNEEYLLPFWLNFHKNIFDHGIIIDYHSTDNSINIIKQICPTWTVVTTEYTRFTYKSDEELCNYERQLSGYKIILNVTEFLFCPYDLKSILPDISNQCIELAGLSFLSKTKNNECNVDSLSELLNNIEFLNIKDRSSRYLHSYDDGKYGCGRHTVKHKIDKTSASYGCLSLHFNIKYEDDKFFPAFIGCMAYYPWNQKLINRKLHVKDKMQNTGWGYHHFWDVEQMTKVKNGLFETGCYPLSQFPLLLEVINKKLEEINITK